MRPQTQATEKLPLFAVMRTRGPAWNHAQPIEGQTSWEAHKLFMNDLEDSGFVILGGPLEGSSDVLIIVRAGGAEEIASKLAADPWSVSDHLRTTRIAPWRLRLGSLP